MQEYRQKLFDFALDPPIKFYIQKQASQPGEIWEYHDLLGVVERGDYVVLTLEEGAAFIPKSWVVKVEQ
tara:strand:- start:685 stop:891 length:207 start_codon:yes stop_codon:yes gene_type:complete